MPTIPNACAILSAEGAQALKDMDHLFDSSLYGPLFCCGSIDAEGSFLKMSIDVGDAPVEVLVPAQYVRAIFKTADLVRFGVYSEKTSRPLPMSQQQLLDAVREQITTQGFPAGAEIPIDLFRSLYFGTPAGLLDLVMSILVGEGLLQQQADGKVVKA